MNLKYNQREDKNKQQLHDIQKKIQKIHLGGGEKKIQKHKSKGKWTARERVDFLLDDPSKAIEIGTFAGYEMYPEHGGCPAGGVIVKIGKVSDKLTVIVANDATVKAGAWFPITGKKNLRAQEIAMENKIPIVYLVDSAGVYLPMQDEIFPDKEHFGRIFRNNAKMSAEGITQIAAIMGSCVAGGAYLPIMSDESMIVEGTGSIFLAGPYLVKAAIGENVDKEKLGGATTQTELSGVVDYKAKDDEEALNRIKSIMAKIGDKPKAGFNKIEPKAPKFPIDEVFGVLPDVRTDQYDMYDLLDRLIDDASFDEYKPNYGKTIICGYARIEGWSVGIVANQRKIVKSAEGEMQVGGVIYSDSADKSARFIANCNQKRIPLVFLTDVTGFMVGSKSENNGIIKDGAKMVNAVSNSVVPKFSIIIGNSYGAGNYAMCGKAYDPSLIAAWPSAKIAVMGGSQAAKVLLQIEEASNRMELSPEEKEKMLSDITKRYDSQTLPEYAAARLWVDEIINPVETRHWISTGIDAANNNPNIEKFNLGVFQV